MVDIIFRNYKPGDDEQLADLFNQAFQMNGAGVVRTPKVINWRYPQSPNWEPEQIQIAEDSDNNKLVGAVYANLIETVPFNDNDYLVGDINDVSCHPDYTGRGIAKKLMVMAIEYMEKKGCDFSILDADYRGFPRKRIYLKLGYEDVDRAFIFFQAPNLFKAMRDMPIMSFLFPALLALSYLPRLLNRIRFKLNSFFKDVSYEINFSRKHLDYMKAINRIMPKNYTGFSPYDIEKMTWARVNVPVKRLKPTYILMKKGRKIVGGAVITHQNFYGFKYGIKVRIGIIHELFLDKAQFNNERTMHLGYLYLIDKVLKAATQRFIPFIIHQVPSKDIALRKAFRGMNFFGLKGPTVMIKPLKTDVKIPRFKKPLFVPPYVQIGVP